MICLTGDVHQEYDSKEQTYYDGTEFEAAKSYINIAKSYDIDVTLFLTGKVAKDNEEGVMKFSRDQHIEIGGHTWNAFRPLWLHRKLFDRIVGSVYGPKWYQKRDIRRTINTLQRSTGGPIKSWRTHSYQSNDHTYEILSNTSIEYISDLKAPDMTEPIEYQEYNLEECPINIIPDHEHLLHGSRTKQTIEQLQENGWSDAFGSMSYSITEWGEKVKSQIDRIEQTDGTATLLIHPGCMKAADNFDTFKSICSHIASNGYDTQTIRAAPQS